MANITQAQFLSTLPDVTIPHLPPPLRGITVRQPWRWLIQFHYGEASLHYEVSKVPRLDGWELGFHCEAKDKHLNRYLLNGFRQHLFEIKDTVGSSVEAEMWDRGWTKIYEIYPFVAMTSDHQKDVGWRVAQLISCIQPIFAELRSDVQKIHR